MRRTLVNMPGRGHKIQGRGITNMVNKRQDQKYHPEQVNILLFGLREFSVENVQAYVGVRHQTVRKTHQQQYGIKVPLQFFQPDLAFAEGIPHKDLDHDVQHQD